MPFTPQEFYPAFEPLEAAYKVALQEFGNVLQTVQPTLVVSPGSGPVSPGFVWSVTVNAPLGEVLLWCAYDQLGIVEMVFDGASFTNNFSSSTQTQLSTTSVRFDVRRNGGHPSDPRFSCRAISSTGGVNV